MSDRTLKSSCPSVSDIEWCGIAMEIRHIPQWARGMDHIEIKSANRCALPITETGYKSHFLPSEQIANYEGAVSYVLAWLDHESKSKAWKTATAKAEQLSLF